MEDRVNREVLWQFQSVRHSIKAFSHLKGADVLGHQLGLAAPGNLQLNVLARQQHLVPYSELELTPTSISKLLLALTCNSKNGSSAYQTYDHTGVVLQALLTHQQESLALSKSIDPRTPQIRALHQLTQPSD